MSVHKFDSALLIHSSEDCVRADVPLTLCTDGRTHGSRRGLWERGCSSERVRSTSLASLLPAITALFSASRPAQPARLASCFTTYRPQESRLRGSLVWMQHGLCPWG